MPASREDYIAQQTYGSITDAVVQELTGPLPDYSAIYKQAAAGRSSANYGIWADAVPIAPAPAPAPAPASFIDTFFNPPDEVDAQVMEAGMPSSLLMQLIAKFAPGLAGGLLGSTAGKVIAGALGAGGAAAGIGALLPGSSVPGMTSVWPWDVPEITINGVQYAVARSWNTGTARFFLLTNGQIAVQDKRGVWKKWRPHKHIVVSRNPRMGTLMRAHKKVNKLYRYFSIRIAKRGN